MLEECHWPRRRGQAIARYCGVLTIGFMRASNLNVSHQRRIAAAIPHAAVEEALGNLARRNVGSATSLPGNTTALHAAPLWCP